MKEIGYPVALVILGFVWLYGGKAIDRAFYAKDQDRVPVATWTNDTTIIKECN